MPWVNVNGHRYYRRSRRVNGRVVTEHVGGGRIGQLAADLDAAERRLRRWDGWEARLDLDLFLAGIRDCLAVDEAVGHLFAVLAGRCGAYRHRRQWRWTRGGKDMATKPTKATAGTLAALAAPAVPPLLPPDFTGIPEEDQAVLRAAAAGDKAALAKCEKYLTDRRYARRWGNPVYAARCWVISQTCGTDRVVGRAAHAYADQLADDLGVGRATALEKLAITRVVSNWLMVGALEAKACGFGVASRERGRVERCLTQAERRLTQAVRALAFLRGVSAADLVARLPLATATVTPGTGEPPTG